MRFTLDPLLRFLMTHYVDDEDLTDRLRRLFKARHREKGGGGEGGRAGRKWARGR